MGQSTRQSPNVRDNGVDAEELARELVDEEGARAEGGEGGMAGGVGVVALGHGEGDVAVDPVDADGAVEDGARSERRLGGLGLLPRGKLDKAVAVRAAAGRAAHHGGAKHVAARREEAAKGGLVHGGVKVAHKEQRVHRRGAARQPARLAHA